MATRAATAAKYGAAQSSIDQSMAVIAKALNIPAPAPMPFKPKDLAHKSAMEHERLAGFLTLVAVEVDKNGKAAKAVEKDAEQANAVTPEPGDVPPAVVARPLQPGDAPGTISNLEADAEPEADEHPHKRRSSKKSAK